MITQWKYTEFNWSMKRAYHLERNPARLQNRLSTFQKHNEHSGKSSSNPAEQDIGSKLLLKKTLMSCDLSGARVWPWGNHNRPRYWLRKLNSLGTHKSENKSETSMPPPQKKEKNKTKQDSQATQPQVDWVKVFHNIPELGTFLHWHTTLSH